MSQPLPWSRPPSFGALLQRYRHRAHLTQERLAGATGYSPGYIGMFERAERTPRPATVELLADALSLAPAERAALLAAALAPTPGLPHGPTPLGTPGRRAYNLPIPSTPLLGREAAVAAARALLCRGDARLVTLTGPAGVGKTRLALEVAAELRSHFVDGTYLVELAALTEPDLVLAAIARVLGVPGTHRQSRAEDIACALLDRGVLLVLDNCEHLIAAAPQIAELLSACPGLTILATSRRPLRVRGEREWPVPPLATEVVGTAGARAALSRCPAVMLFLQRAQAVKPGFQLTDETAPLVAEICARLDGLPLAIELAAPHVKLLSPHMLLERLTHRLDLLVDGPRDLPLRQRTLRDTLEWSYNLMGPAQRRLFDRLAVFAGGCTLEAVAALCGPPGDAAVDLLRDLSALVDGNLVWQRDLPGGESRIGLLETIREFGLERLPVGGETESLRRRHAEYYLTIAETAEPELRGPQPEIALDRLEREHDNLRAALRWAEERRELEVGLRLAATLASFWEMHSYLSEGRAWMRRLLALSEEAGGARVVPPAVWARALRRAGRLAAEQHDLVPAADLMREALERYRQLADGHGVAQTLTDLAHVAIWQDDDHAEGLYAEALALWRELGDGAGAAQALIELSQLLQRRGDYARTGRLAEQSLEVFRELDDKEGIAESLFVLGNVLRRQGAYDRSLAAYEESLALWRRLGHRESIASTLLNMGSLALALGDHERARARFAQSLALFEEVGAQRGIATATNGLGDVALLRGDYTRAARLLERSRALWRVAGSNWGVAGAQCDLGRALRARGDAPAAMELYQDSLRLYHALGARLGAAECLEDLASLATDHGQADRAARLYGAAEALREAGGTPRTPAERSSYDRDVAALATVLGEEAMAAASTWGRGLSFERAVAYALETSACDQPTDAQAQPLPAPEPPRGSAARRPGARDQRQGAIRPTSTVSAIEQQ